MRDTIFAVGSDNGSMIWNFVNSMPQVYRGSPLVIAWRYLREFLQIFEKMADLAASDPNLGI